MRRIHVPVLLLALVGLAVGVPAASSAATARPTVASVAPAAGAISGGDRVVVTGTGFGQIKAVLFGQAAGRSVHVISPTRLRVTTPRHATGTVDVRVRTGSGTSRIVRADRFTFVARPTVTSVTPSSGRITGGTTITIGGRTFGHVRSVLFGKTVARSWKLRSSTKMVVVAPAHASGVVDVRVRTDGGTSLATAVDRFTYVSPPTITSLTPSAGPLAGGNRVTIMGRNFNGITQVTFGARPATAVTRTSATRLIVTAPAGASGTVDVRVTGAYGTSASATSDHYFYAVDPALPGVTTVTAPGPFGPDTYSRPQIRSTACTWSTCYAVGFYTTDVADIAVIETLANGTWGWAYAPRPSDGVAGASQLYSLSCAGNSCIAVGAYLTTNGKTMPLVETLTDGAWNASAGTHPGGVSEAYYSDVECVTATACVASGHAPGGPIVSQLADGSWRTSFLPVPTGLSRANVSPSAIACGSASHCVLVGDYFDGAELQPFVETMQGETWTPALLPAPAGGRTYGLLSAAACPSATRCIAVGRYQAADGDNHALVATDTSGSWVSAVLPLPGNAVTATPSTDLWAISCAGGQCTAVGAYDTAQGSDGLVVRLENGVWTPMRLAKSSSDPASYRTLYGVSCQSQADCTVVGGDGASGTPSTAFVAADTAGGSAETAVSLPVGTTAADLIVQQVACTSANLCTAVGVLSTDPSQWLLISIDR